jgi:hypothetical protein
MLFRKNVIEKKSFINWRILPLIKINTFILDAPCIEVVQKHNYATFTGRYKKVDSCILNINKFKMKVII